MKRFIRTPFPKKYNSQLNESETFQHTKHGAGTHVSGEEVRGFTRVKEDFICKKCGARVTGSGYTNHCPKCLWSKHVDQHPGDRSSLCGGSMEPIGVSVFSSDTFRILHKCKLCGFTRAQNAAKEDSIKRLIELSASPFKES